MQQIKWGIIFLAGIIVQSTFTQLIAIHDIRPDILIIILTFYGLRFGQLRSTIMGFTIGFFQDLLSGGLLGQSSLTKSIAGFIVGFYGKKNKRVVQEAFFWALGIGCLFHNTFFMFIATFGTDVEFWNMFVYLVLPSSAYTFVIGLLSFFILGMWR